MARLRKVPVDNPARVCAITLGELEWGSLRTPTTDQRKRDKYLEFIRTDLHPWAYEVTRHSGDHYAEILRRIWERNPPGRKVRTQKRLTDLGVDVNDVWIVAVAWEHNLTLLTTDQMPIVREAVQGDVEFDNWC